MTVDPHKNLDASADSSATNPYAPPVWEATDEVARPASSTAVSDDDVQAVPDPDFWAVSFMIIGLLLVAMFLSYALIPIGLVALVSFVMGILRVCFVYSRRARARLSPLPYGQLLFTSTLISLGILVCSAVTFFTACSVTVPFLWQASPPYGVASLLATLVVSFAVTVFLFVKSFALSM